MLFEDELTNRLNIFRANRYIKMPPDLWTRGNPNVFTTK